MPNLREQQQRSRAFVRELLERPLPDPPVVGECTLEQIERFAILATLRKTNGATHETARILQVSPRTIQYRLEQWRDAGW